MPSRDATPLQPIGRRALLALAMTALLTACQTAPPAPPKETPAQARAKALSQAGFVAGEDGWALNLDSRVLFAFDSDALSDQARLDAKKLIKVLMAAEIDRVRVEGHTDNVGSADFNQRLSLRRAEAVAREFAAHGMPRANISAVGFGMTKPVADNKTEEGRAQNRRVAIIVPAL
jgi:outer membrane protein OmpA-like peptidoglycan-associated protein